MHFANNPIAFIIFPLSLALSACATTLSPPEPQLNQALKPMRATVVSVEEWDSCYDRPGSVTRSLLAARRASRQQVTSDADEDVLTSPEGTALQAAGATYGAVEGAGIGIMAGAMAGARGGSDIITGAAAGAIAGLIISSNTEGLCLSQNKLTWRNEETGEIGTRIVDKKRSKALEKWNKWYLSKALFGELGSDTLKPGDELLLIPILSSYVPKGSRKGYVTELYWAPVTPEDYQKILNDPETYPKGSKKTTNTVSD